MASSDTTFITIDEIKEYAPIDYNIDGQWLFDSLLYAQSDWLRQILGKDFYAELQQQVFDETLTMENAELIDEYIKRPLAMLSIARALKFLQTKITAVGVVINQPAHSEAASMADVAAIQNELINRGQFYLMRMIDFLRDNKELYPLFSSSDYCNNTLNNPYRRGQLYLGRRAKNQTVWNDLRSSMI